jgi:hypothetical protein
MLPPTVLRLGVVDQWHCPDHAKIEEFRSRLAPETPRQVTNAIVCWATQLGFADPAKMDIDSTVQEANITYPSDAHLMVKLTLLAGKVWTYLKENLSYFADFTPTVDVKAVKAKAKAHFFDARKDQSKPTPPYWSFGGKPLARLAQSPSISMGC